VDRRLDDSLGKFDEELRREQQRTAEQRDARAANRAAGEVADAVDDDFNDKDEERTALDRNRAGDLRSETPEETARSGEGPGQEGAGALPVGGGGVAARQIPSGDDDDIIARRLRKAAETETDPELRDKLWKEYIDYKENTRGG
jgi:hypothetical protein